MSSTDPYAPPRSTTTPRPSALGPSAEPASLGKRLGAYLIDGILIVVVGSLCARSYGAIVGDALTPRALRIGMLLPIIVQWALIAMRGQTAGKIALRMRIVMAGGAKVDVLHGVLLRSVPVALLQLGPAFLAPKLGPIASVAWLVDVLVIFAAGSRCAHDRIAGTYVVDA